MSEHAISEAKRRILDAMAELGLKVEADFIPFSQSRNKAERQPSLNWRVRLKRGDRTIIETDYMAGCGHCPSYKSLSKGFREELIAVECETGKPAFWSKVMGGAMPKKGMGSLAPDPADVVHSLVMDGSAIDAGGFGEWASEFGYDADSRKAEAIYRECLDTGLKLRAALGDGGLAKLREASRDY